MASKSEPILTEEHCELCRKGLELNQQQAEILRMCGDLFPALQEFKAEMEEFRKVFTGIRERFFPGVN